MRIALLIALALAPLPGAAQTMEPGEWEFTSTITSPMLPKPQVSTIKRCMTKEDVADPTGFTARNEAADCQVTPGSRTSGSFSWTVACPKQGMVGTGKARFGSSTTESEMQMTMEMQGQKMEMLSRTSGRRVGPCPAK